MNVFGRGITDVGRKRQSNEDAFMVDDDLGLYVVADGMGGHRAGEVASGEAIDALCGMVRRDEAALQALDSVGRDTAHSPESPSEMASGVHEVGPALQRVQRVIERGVQAATYMVYGLSEANPERKGMGTTVSALIIRGCHAISGQVGDSRIYLIRGGRALQVTEDHTLVAWQVKKGLITAEEAKHSSQKNVITRAVGSREYVQVDTRILKVRPGDGFLICSDGLHGYLTADEIPALFALGPEAGASKAIDIANGRGGKDNITAVFVVVE